MDTPGSRQTAIGRALAVTLGWPLVDGRPPDELHLAVARVLGRREHLTVTTAPLNSDQQNIVRGDLQRVRFVDLTDQRGDAAEVVTAIQREFGL